MDLEVSPTASKLNHIPLCFALGPKCEFDFNNCKKSHCKNGGVCVDQGLYSACVCKYYYTVYECVSTII